MSLEDDSGDGDFSSAWWQAFIALGAIGTGIVEVVTGRGLVLHSRLPRSVLDIFLGSGHEVYEGTNAKMEGALTIMMGTGALILIVWWNKYQRNADGRDAGGGSGSGPGDDGPAA